MKISIRTKLIVAILVPLLAVYVGVLIGNYYSARQEVVRQAERYLIQLTANEAASLDGVFLKAQRAAESLASLAGEQSREMLQRRADVILRGMVQTRGDVQSAAVYLEPETTEAGLGVASRTYEAFGRFAARQVPGGESPGRSPAMKRGPGGGRFFGARAGRGKGSPPSGGRPKRRPRDLSDPEDANGAPPAPRAAEAFAQLLRRGDLKSADPNFTDHSWYLQARMREEPVWTEPLIDDPVAGVPVCRCSAPIFREGEFVGVVAVDISVRTLRSMAMTNPKLEGGYCVLVSREGLIVGHPNKDVAMRETLVSLAEQADAPSLAALARPMAAGLSKKEEFHDFHTGYDSWIVYAPIESPGWSVASIIPRWRVLAPIDEWIRRDSAIMLGGLGLIVFVVTMVSVRITRPVQQLVSAVRVLGGGDLKTRVGGTHRRDEFGELSRAFNGMVRALAHHINARTREAAARRAVESELKVAREIQASLLPGRPPEHPSLELHATIVPAREVAGDFFDFFFVSEHELAVVIADVSGKGIPASLFMAVSRTVIRDQAMAGHEPAEVLNRANRLLAQGNERMMFVTLFLARYNLQTGRLLFANAGHNPPCVANGRGEVGILNDPTGPILGVFEHEQYGQREVRLAPGESIVMYTDGVTEAMDAENNQFRVEHLARIIRDNPEASPRELCDLVVQSVETHRGQDNQQDDVTMLVLRRRGQQ